MKLCVLRYLTRLHFGEKLLVHLHPASTLLFV